MHMRSGGDKACGGGNGGVLTGGKEPVRLGPLVVDVFSKKARVGSCCASRLGGQTNNGVASSEKETGKGVLFLVLPDHVLHPGADVILLQDRKNGYSTMPVL